MHGQERNILLIVGERISVLLKGQIPEKISLSDDTDETDRQLIEIVNQLIDSSSEIQRFIVPLSQGDLYHAIPKRCNFLSSPFKELHARLLHLTWQAEQVAEGDYSQRVDFMGDFSTAFNSMVMKLAERENELRNANEQLEERVRERTVELTREVTERKRAEIELKAAQEEMVATARKAGMAEVAADILHNIGNVLNSINISTTTIREKILATKTANLSKVVRILNDHMEDIGTFLTEHPQGKHIPTYLTEVSKALNAEQSDLIRKLEAMARSVNHIKDIISMQQSCAKVSNIELQTSLTELADDAININQTNIDIYGIQVVREYDELSDVEIDRQKVLQILVNLISNAFHALKHTDQKEKMITVRIYPQGEHRCRIEVADNGVGIPRENVIKIFNHGFTTRKNGHGFGLHSSVLASNQIGGSLTVHSDGEGQGATFTLELPFKPTKVTS